MVPLGHSGDAGLPYLKHVSDYIGSKRALLFTSAFDARTEGSSLISSDPESPEIPSTSGCQLISETESSVIPSE